MLESIFWAWEDDAEAKFHKLVADRQARPFSPNYYEMRKLRPFEGEDESNTKEFRQHE